MSYGTRDLARIKLRICLDCKEADAGNYRRCLPCRVRRVPPRKKRPGRPPACVTLKARREAGKGGDE